MTAGDQKIVLVTGASRGIGRAIALAFAALHYRVGVNYENNKDKAEEASGEIKKAGGEGLLLKADVSDPAAVDKMFDGLLSKWGRLDVLVNNAGITRDRTILKMSDDEWRRVIEVNLNGAFWCLRRAAKEMAGSGGSIVNISSIVGVRGSVGSANYSAAKAGLMGLTKTAARELGRFDIKVNCILPGYHLTDMGATVWGKYADRIRQEHTLGRLTDMQELARFVVFAAEQNSASGQVFNFESRVI